MQELPASLRRLHTGAYIQALTYLPHTMIRGYVGRWPVEFEMELPMSAFPVTLILRPFLDFKEPLQILCNMAGHSTMESAVAATPREPGDQVKPLYWAVPSEDFSLPAGSLWP
jgi:hypothetical protein